MRDNSRATHEESELPQGIVIPSLQRRFEFLDPLRGIAAILVVLTHMGVVAIGYFAVLAFFVISGYCITAAAEAGIRKKMKFSTFLKRRIRRIYPPYFASVIFFALTRIAKGMMEGDYSQISRPVGVWIQNLTLTQWLGLTGNNKGYPYDSDALFVAAYWSLNYEEQFYIVVGLAMLVIATFKASLRSILLGVTIITLAIMALYPQLCVGFFFDYWPIFGVGVLIYYRTAGDSSKSFNAFVDAALVAVFVFCVCLLVFGVRPDPERRFFWEDLSVAIGLGLMLIVIKRFDHLVMRSPLVRVFKAIGLISFSLYLVHQFNMKLAATVANYAIDPSISLLGNNAIQLVVHLCIALVFWFLFERPFLNVPSVGGIAPSWQLPSPWWKSLFSRARRS